MKRLIKYLGNRKGSVLIASFIASAVLLSLSGPYLNMVVSEAKINMKSANITTAINVAEYGVETAIWEVLYNNSNFSSGQGWGGTDTKTKTGALLSNTGTAIGEYTITVTGLSGSTPQISVTGYVPSIANPKAQKTVTVGLKPKSLFDMGIFATDGITLSSNASTNSYDSSLGNYGGANIGQDGDVGTNSIANAAINLSSNARINGDATIGPSGNTNTAISVSSNALITGTKSAASSTVDLDPVTGPTGLTLNPAISLGGNSSQTISASGQYPSITLSSNSILTINADATIYVTGAITLSSNTRIDITNGAQVAIYVDGSVSLNSNSQINLSSKIPANLSLYGTDTMTGSGITLNSNSAIYGTVYTKNANVALNSNAVIYGALIAKQATLNSNAAVHYDTALQSSDGPSAGKEVSYWQEK